MFRQLLSFTVTVALVSGQVTNAKVSGGRAPISAPVEQQVAFSGQELYRGVLLGYGPVATRIPEVRNQLALALFVPNDTLRRAVIRAYEGIMREIARSDPRFFPTFQQELHSGDPVRIEQAMQRAASVTQQTVVRMQAYRRPLARVGQRQDKLDTAYSRLTDSLAIDDLRTISETAGFLFFGPTVAAAAIVLFVVVHNQVAITAAVAVVIAVKFWIGANPAQSRLLRERIVASVATQFVVR